MKKILLQLLKLVGIEIAVVGIIFALWLFVSVEKGKREEPNKLLFFEGRDINDPALGEIKNSLRKICPPGATNIKVEWRPAREIFAGSSLVMWCHVSKEDMLAFTKSEKRRAKGWRYDSTVMNVETNGVQAMTQIALSDVLSRDAWWRAQSPTFWSYHKIYSNHGGIRFFYFVETETMFYDESSH